MAVNPDLYWGEPPTRGYKLRYGSHFVDVDNHIRSAHVMGTGDLLTTYSFSEAKILRNGAWTPGATYAQAIDIAGDGTPIGRSHSGMVAPIYMNGKWTAIKRAAPEIPLEWTDFSRFVDTTPGGWILAARDIPASASEFAVMVPLRVSGTFTRSIPFPGATPLTEKKAAGVDDFSISSSAPGPAVKDRIWIMAPQGATGNVTMTSPLNGNSKLEVTADKITFSGQETLILDKEETTFTIRADDDAVTGQDIPLVVKTGDASSISSPIGIKVMKKRVVKINVFRVARTLAGGSYMEPDLYPTPQQLTNHLNDIYKPQVNVTFDILMAEPTVSVPWDLNRDQTMTGAGIAGYSSEQLSILNALPTLRAADISVLIISSRKNDGSVAGLQLTPGDSMSEGLTYRLGNPGYTGPTCWILGERSGTQILPSDQLDTVAHEIGHVMVGVGHPDLPGLPGPAELLETNVSARLMCSGQRSNRNSRLLVKGEWDAADIWLRNRPQGDY